MHPQLKPLCVVALLGTAAPAIGAPAARHWLLSASDVSVSEEDCGRHAAVFEVRLFKRVSALPPQVISVDYATEDGTAIGGVDYTPGSGTLTFTPPTRLLTVTVPITDGVVPGPDKTFGLRLSNASGAVISKPVGIATLHAPTVAKCASCGLSCDDGLACTEDSCSASLGCRNVDANACATPVALLGSCGLDSDGDGLSDAWEKANAIDSDCDGVITRADQPLPGADPAQPDVFLLYDWMVLADDGGACVPDPIPGYPNNSPDCAVDQYCLEGVCRGHSDEPDPASLGMVAASFANHGVALHLEAGSVVPHSRVVAYGEPIDACTAASSSLPGTRRDVDFYDLKDAGFAPTRKPAYHYAVFAHFHTCDSVTDCAKPECTTEAGTLPVFGETGFAEQPGNDLIVSLGRRRDLDLPPGTIRQGGTFMHELGHNLGLAHGGPLAAVPEAYINFKPNYLSVMNYSFQATGISTAAEPGSTRPVTTRLDYSNAALQPLDEAHLDETAGIASGDNDITVYYCPDRHSGPGTGPIDWNCIGGIETDVAAEINNDPVTEVLAGHADWPSLFYPFQGFSTYNDGPADAGHVTQQELADPR
jgi:hypothetical protein